MSFRGGGWVLLLAAAGTLLAAWPLLRPVLRFRGARAVGDGRLPDSEVPIALAPGSLRWTDLNAPDRINAITPTGPIEARFKVLGTRTRQGGWIWAWTDPSVPENIRVARDALRTFPASSLDAAWNPRPGDIERIVLAAATSLRAIYVGEMETVVGIQYVLLFEPVIARPSPPSRIQERG